MDQDELDILQKKYKFYSSVLKNSESDFATRKALQKLAELDAIFEKIDYATQIDATLLDANITEQQVLDVVKTSSDDRVKLFKYDLKQIQRRRSGF